MARLIDADDVINKIRGKVPGSQDVDFIVRLIEEEPTAYNVEKVVEELESLRIDKSNYFGVLNVVAEKYDRANEMLNDATEIVRKGGV